MERPGRRPGPAVNMARSNGLSPVAAAVVFTLLVPGPMAVVIPGVMTRWQVRAPLLGMVVNRWIGAGMIVIGAVSLLSAIYWLAHEGAKPYPPIERLVTTGPYAYTRNPMYGGVVLLMVGQGLLFGSRGVIIYGLCWLAAFWIFELVLDDPFIAKRIGKDYEDYMRRVPRWVGLPRARR